MANLRGPSEHLLWSELACHDGTEYPQEWRFDRATRLAVTFEDVRVLLGNHSIVILSGYRTKAYNATLEGSAAKSQHIEGRAIDIWHPLVAPNEVFTSIRESYLKGHLPFLGGLGIYKTFVHMDVRPRSGGHLATWAGTGAKIPV